MQGTQVEYNGRLIAKEGFRAFIYGAQGTKKLVNSWDEFEAHMASGIWFSKIEDVPSEVQEEPAKDSKQESFKKRGK
jgi:hypothetical protein